MAYTDKQKFCLTHPNEKIQMFCSDCDKTVCLKCISGPHTRHQFISIDEVVHEKRDQLNKSMATIEDTISTFTAALNSVKTNYEDYTREMQTLTDKVIRNGKEWKKQIDQTVDMVLVQMKTTADQDLDEIKKREADLSKNLTELQEFHNSFKEKLKSTEALSIMQLAEDVKEKEKSQKPCPRPTVLYPPHFVSDRIDVDHLKEAFGQIIQDNEEAASDFAGSVNLRVNPHIATTTIATNPLKLTGFVRPDVKPCIAATTSIATNNLTVTGSVNQRLKSHITTTKAINTPTITGLVDQRVKPHIDKTTVDNITSGICTCVSTVGEDEAWVGWQYENKVIAHVRKGGQVLRKVDSGQEPGKIVFEKVDLVLEKVDLGFKPGDVTTTSTGEVLVTDHNNHKVKIYTMDGNYVSWRTIIHTSPYRPQGLCTTSDNNILVCLYQRRTKNKVIRVTTTGQTKQTIQHDQQNKPLFTNPRLIQENINKDVCVEDAYKTLVVVNREGELRFRYPDKSTHSTSITCSGIVCDSSGNILLSDLDNNRIHMIDINGHFVQHVLAQKHGIKQPYGLSINNNGELWVCNNGGREVKVIKYNSTSGGHIEWIPYLKLLVSVLFFLFMMYNIYIRLSYM